MLKSDYIKILSLIFRLYHYCMCVCNDSNTLCSEKLWMHNNRANHYYLQLLRKNISIFGGGYLTFTQEQERILFCNTIMIPHTKDSWTRICSSCHLVETRNSPARGNRFKGIVRSNRKVTVYTPWCFNPVRLDAILNLTGPKTGLRGTALHCGTFS